MLHHSHRHQHTTSGIKRDSFLFSGIGSHLYNLVAVPLAGGLYNYVAREVSATLTQGTILDAGCGTGALALKITRKQPDLQVYGVDLAPDMLALARQKAQQKRLTDRLHFEHGDLAHLSHPDNTFDLVISTLSFHHWMEPTACLQELYRVLRPGAWLRIYDFRVVTPTTMQQVLQETDFAKSTLSYTRLHTGWLPFYARFAIQKPTA